ncbi:MAG: glycosyltransferase [Parcubacteria group bacterium]|nr:glycosyltransferase [Parcubacteria group bacterium]
MLHIFHLQPTALDEATRLCVEHVLKLANEVRTYGQARLTAVAGLPSAKHQPLEPFTSHGPLPIATLFYHRRHLAPILASLNPGDRLVLTDWASCLLIPATASRKFRAIQFVSALPADLPASWQHGFVKASNDLRIIVPNAFIKKTLVSWGVDDGQIIEMAPPFASQIPVQPYQETPGSFIAGTVSRLAPDQGLETVLQAVQACVDVIPPIKLFIIGDGPDKRRLLWLIEQMHLKPRTQIAANDHDYRRFLMNLTVCLAANTQDTRFNPLIAHALARGVPVVATDITGHRAMVEHGKNALLYAPGNSHVLAQHLINLYTHPKWMTHYKQIGPEVIRSRYDDQQFLTRMADLLQS